MKITPQQRYRAKNPEKVRAMQAAWRARNPGYFRRHAEGYKDRKRQLARERKYPEQATRPQPASCERCNRYFDHTIPALRPCHDHDHTTGVFRGWLCNSCNITLARAGDSREGLQSFIGYLDRAELLA